MTRVQGEQDPRVLQQAGAACSRCCNLPLPSPQTHPSAWPFMEPVKKSEAPDYYEIIRFPIGRWLCLEPQRRMVEGGLKTPCCEVWARESWLGCWGAGSPRTVQKREGGVRTLSWCPAPWLGGGTEAWET